MRQMKIFSRHEYVRERISNTPNVNSPGLIVTPPNNVFLAVPRFLLPVIKLFKSDGSQVSADTRIFVGKRRPGDMVPTFAPGAFEYLPFFDLTTAQQRDGDNKGNLNPDLGKGILLREQEDMLIQFEGPDPIDWTKPGTTFEFDVEWNAQ